MPKYVVRHGSMRLLGVFSTSRGETFGRGVRVISRTSRGQEAGEVLCEATPHALENLSAPGHGQILRRMSAQDELELRKLHDQAGEEHKACHRQIETMGLEMQLVDVEHLFGGERVVVYYLAENRVDFRDLVRALASEFQTRIEMRQIGVRDEAKLLADYGDCGKEVCCNTHLSEMPPVSMKMAKLQRATLDPSKISGRCGRLKCCLRYEYDTYVEMRKDLPPVGAEVITENGRAKVLAQEILASQLLVQMEDSRRVMIDATEVLTVLPGNQRSREETTKPKHSPQTSDTKPAPKETPPNKPGPESKSPDSKSPDSKTADKERSNDQNDAK